MVSTITPNATGAGALGVDPRYGRANTKTPTQLETGQNARPDGRAGDRVEIGDVASWSGARESVRVAITQLTSAMSAGQDVLELLGKVQTIARNAAADPEAAAKDLDDAMAALKQRVDAAVGEGANILAGDDLTVQAEPGAPSVTVAGLDLRLKSVPGAADALKLGGDASVEDPEALDRAAQRSREIVAAGLDRFYDAARALEAHQGFLGAVEGAAGVRTDLDADAARLLALQVRQGLDAAGGSSIANADPKAVLALFRA